MKKEWWNEKRVVKWKKSGEMERFSYVVITEVY